MSFVLSELIVESVLREGFTSIRNDPTLLDDIFQDMITQSYLSLKYGERELNKIKKLFQERDVAVVHAYHQVPANTPCVSIQLMNNPEDESKAHLGDFEEDFQEEYEDAEDLEALIIVSNISVNSYQTLTGFISVDDATDLSAVRRGNIFVDAAGTEFKILNGVSDEAGAKGFYIAKKSTVDISAECSIKTAINYTQTEIQGVVEKERIILGVHTKEALLTKYMYVIVKYILNARKTDLIRRGYQNPTYDGSDFSRSLDYPGDQVFNRFLTLTGMVQQSWRADKVVPIDAVDVIVNVDKDDATTDQADRTNQTVQIQEDDE